MAQVVTGHFQLRVQQATNSGGSRLSTRPDGAGACSVKAVQQTQYSMLCKAAHQSTHCLRKKGACTAAFAALCLRVPHPTMSHLRLPSSPSRHTCRCCPQASTASSSGDVRTRSTAHLSTQPWWYWCPQGKRRSTAPPTYSSRQMEQRSQPPQALCPAPCATVTIGMAAMAPSLAPAVGRQLSVRQGQRGWAASG